MLTCTHCGRTDRFASYCACRPSESDALRKEYSEIKNRYNDSVKKNDALRVRVKQLEEVGRKAGEALKRLLHPMFEWVNVGEASGRVAPEPVYKYHISTLEADAEFGTEALTLLQQTLERKETP